MTWLQNIQEKIPWVRRLNRLQRYVQQLVRLEQEAYVADLLRQEKYQDARHLARHEFQVCSQNGEDGILAEIFRRIGTHHKTFVEIGTGSGLENNTALLLSQGWRGIWIEGNDKSARRIRQRFASFLKNGTLKLVARMVNRDDVEHVLRQAGVADEIDLLSIDVDYNTYWIWEAMAHLRSRVAVIEYNASFPPWVDWMVPYDPNGSWDGSFCFGASLKALELLGRRRNMNLVGCDLHGANAFFVSQGLCGERFLAPYDSETHFEPPRYFLVRTAGHARSARLFSRSAA
jgi:hypothetical protein